ncbi:Asr1405/Asl0597 family protein [Nodularia sp. NIES-3585]|uniref:Asr1405/Asl0597 family protein n=1 Tax=Nodularia sp. NIES-3585 TaxID=1973477 RepID=UPI000B5C21AB|nr:Asr1405/Asl0597 family protein [Nodularia sp. NIES-3585]
MKSLSSEIKTNFVVGVEVDWSDRWHVYKRLQELDIPCWCEANQPLRVEIKNPLAVVQLWSVMQQLTTSRQDLICNLEHCWKGRYRKF